MPSTRRCVFGYDTTGVTVHSFPNPRVFQERFRIWVGLAGASVSGLTDMQIYTNRKVCDRHFAEKYKNRNSRLNATAIPHLHISMPLPSVATKVCLNLQSDFSGTSVPISEATIPLSTKEFYVCDDPVPSTSKASLASMPLPPVASKASHNLQSDFPGTSVQISEATTPSTTKEFYVCDDPVSSTSKASLASSSRTVSSVRRDFYKKTRNLRTEISRLRKGKKNFRERLQKAEKLSNQVMLQTLTKKMLLPAKIFSILQFRECGKKPKGRRFLKEEKVLALSLYKRSPKCYALLYKCFTLPSAKSLKNLLAKIVIKEGVNPIIFKKIASNVKDLPNDE